VPVLGTNIDITGYPALGLWMSSTVIKDAGGVKVGFFGLTTPFDALERPYPVVIRTDLAVVAAEAAAKLRFEGAQVVVCVAHTGLELSREIARTVPGIDVILNGHDHVALAKPEAVERPGGGTTIIVSAGEYYRWVARLRLSVNGDRVSVVDYDLLGADADAPALPEVQAVVDYLKAGIVARYGDVYHQQLARANKPISESWDPRHDKRDTALGNLFTDAYRDCTNTDIAIEATGFLDEGLPSGPIVGAEVFRSMSYGIPEPDPALGRYIVKPFRLATFRLTGAELMASLEIAVSSSVDLFPQVSGLSFTFDSSRPFGNRVLVDSLRVGNRRWDPEQLYSVTANEGLVMFLPNLGITPRDVSVLAISAFDAARAALAEQRGVLNPVVTGRIRDVASIPGQSR
jgi:5'-nucleotidase